jgi:hypothetical protein
MGVTLNGIDIETIIDIRRTQRPKFNNIALGIHAVQINQMMKSTLLQYEVKGVWSLGSADYESKEKMVQNIQDSGLPVWLDATSWRRNSQIFGKITEFECYEVEGKVDVTEFRFIMMAVFPWGYMFVQSDGAGIIRIYDLERSVQSRTINPILRRCSWFMQSTSVFFAIYVKNISGTSANLVLEMMVPDEIDATNVSTKVTEPSLTWTRQAGTVGTSGFSSIPGTKQRVTFGKTFAGGVEELLQVTINYVSAKTSFIDGSIDDTSA